MIQFTNPNNLFADDSLLPVKHCSASWFGCCPDGATFATDAEGTGCPSDCNCHRLGSIEMGCDPISQQCHCKPGVGGLQCDRCEPGYWGLAKITTGHQGCIRKYDIQLIIFINHF